MKKPVYRCLTNPTNFIGTSRTRPAKYKRVTCGSCGGTGQQDAKDILCECWLCEGKKKISLRMGK